MDILRVLCSSRLALIKKPHISDTSKTGYLVELERRVTEWKICLVAASKSLVPTYVS